MQLYLKVYLWLRITRFYLLLFVRCFCLGTGCLWWIRKLVYMICIQYLHCTFSQYQCTFYHLFSTSVPFTLYLVPVYLLPSFQYQCIFYQLFNTVYLLPSIQYHYTVYCSYSIMVPFTLQLIKLTIYPEFIVIASFTICLISLYHLVFLLHFPSI